MKSLTETWIDVQHFINKCFSLITSPREKKKYKYDISFVCIFKNEVPYLKEWIEYHKMIAGPNSKVHFYMYDNKSTDHPKKLLKEYLKNKEISYHYVNADNYPQIQVYTNAVLRYRNKTKYMAFTDVDEFIVPTKNDFLLSTLDIVFAKDSSIGGIGINWLCFGSSGHISKPAMPVIEAYTKRSDFSYPENKHIKTIANPRKILWFFNAHFPKYRKGFHNINDSFEEINDFFNEHREYKILRLHHYACKSLEEAKAREEKGFGKKSYMDINKIKHKRHDINDVDDTVMIDRYVSYIKDRIL